ncbi:MAG: O-antigen ligase family protein [Acidobacteriota bacterium]
MSARTTGHLVGGLGWLLLVPAFVLPFVLFGGRHHAIAYHGAAILAVLAALCLAAGSSILARLETTRPQASGDDEPTEVEAGEGDEPADDEPAAVSAPASTGLPLTWPAVSVALLLAIALFQLVPLPVGLVESLSPRRAAIAKTTPVDVSAWAEPPARRSLAELLAEEAADPKSGEAVVEGRSSASLSFDPDFGVEVTLLLAAWLLLLLVLARRPWVRACQVWLTFAVVTIAAGPAFAIYQAKVIGGRLVYGKFPMPPGLDHRPFGPFYSENHFGGVAALAVPLAIGLALSRTLAWPLRILAGGCVPVLVVGVLGSGSRGGFLALIAGIAGLILAWALGPGRRLVGLIALVVVVGGGAFVAATQGERLFELDLEENLEMGSGSNFQRMTLYQRQWSMVKDTPLGHGLAAFPEAEAAGKTEADWLAPYHGESDWLETLVELGWPGWLAWWSLLLACWLPGWRLALQGRAPLGLIGLLGASLATVLHAMVDYHHREPAVGALSLIVAASARAWALSLSGRTSARRSERFLLVAALIVLVLQAVFAPGWVRFQRATQKVQGAASTAASAEDWKAVRELAVTARDLAPDRAEGHAALAYATEQHARHLRGRERRDGRQQALEAAVAALDRHGASPGTARRAASLLLSLGREEHVGAAARLARAVAPHRGTTQLLLGRLALFEERRDEALDHFVSAYQDMPAHRLVSHGKPVIHGLHRASAGERTAVLQRVDGPRHRVIYLMTLDQAGAEGVLTEGAAWLAEQEIGDEAPIFTPLLVQGQGPEVAALARRLLPGLTEPLDRHRAGVALARGDAVDEGRAVLEGQVSAGEATPMTYYWLGHLALRAKDPATARRWAEDGLAKHAGNGPLEELLAAASR